MTTRLSAMLFLESVCLVWLLFGHAATASALQSGDTAQKHLDAGQAAYSSKDYGAAMKEFKRAESMDKAKPETYVWLARCYLATNKPKEAVKTLEHAIKVDPGRTEPHLLLARIYYQENNIAKAKQQVELAISAGANGAGVHALRAELFMADDDPADALKEYELAAQLAQPGDPALPDVQVEIDGLKSFLHYQQGPRQTSQDSTFQMPRALNRPRPAYSEEARSRHIQGIVKEKALVDHTGQIRTIIFMQRLGYGLDEQAAAATRAMKFQPALKDGQPIAFWVVLEIEFNLR